MSKRPVVPRQDLEAAVEARKELGADYEQAIVDSLADRLDRELERRAKERSRPRAGRGPAPIAYAPFAVGAVAVGGVFAGLAGVIVVCAAIVLVALIGLRR